MGLSGDLQLRLSFAHPPTEFILGPLSLPVGMTLEIVGCLIIPALTGWVMYRAKFFGAALALFTLLQFEINLSRINYMVIHNEVDPANFPVVWTPSVIVTFAVALLVGYACHYLYRKFFLRSG